MPHPTAAQAIYPHLANRPAPSPSPQPRPSDLARAMYSHLAPKPPPKVRVALINTRTTEATTYGAGYESYQMALRQWRR
jgi:hypothetical protein